MAGVLLLSREMLLQRRKVVIRSALFGALATPTSRRSHFAVATYALELQVRVQRRLDTDDTVWSSGRLRRVKDGPGPVIIRRGGDVALTSHGRHATARVIYSVALGSRCAERPLVGGHTRKGVPPWGVVRRKLLLVMAVVVSHASHVVGVVINHLGAHVPGTVSEVWGGVGRRRRKTASHVLLLLYIGVSAARSVLEVMR